jgi:hypothetical protein
VKELPPSLVAVQQDLSVVAGRPATPCIVPPPYYNYGTVVAVVFSKPMTQASAGATNSYTLDGDNGANSVQIQPSGRVALMNLRKGISAIIPRHLTISGVTDVRGNALVAAPTPVQSFYPGTTNLFTAGVAVKGRVLLGDGSPAVGVPVTLTMYDKVTGGNSGCLAWTRRVSQVLTDSGGNFNLDYVMSGIPYSLSASDTTALPPGALQLVMSATIAGQPDSQQLMQLINASSNPSSLLALLSAGTLAQAVAIVAGLDRAVINDSVGFGSGREGQTVPFVLRFRGRATVTGQVVADDGVTAVPNAAVNLFPDPSTLELGRGMFSDGTGQFSFPGVPLGVFTVQVATSDHRSATVLGFVDTPGETTNLVISLPTNVVLYATVGGQVFDSDNLTPVPNARVYLGRYNLAFNTVSLVASMTTADITGSWQVTNVPIQTIDIVAVTFDGTRKGVRTGINPVANSITYANVTLQAATTVSGQVTFDNGAPATNALVAGGVALARTDANGNFQLQGVPVGSATISAGLERNPAAGIDFPRLGSTTANIVAGEANYVVVKLRPAGRIFGQVFDAQGKPQPGIEVAIPQQGGFYWTMADTNGIYAFENLGLGGYILSAPGNAVAPQLNESQLSSQLSSGDEAQILAAFNEAVTVFVGANDPLVNGDQLNFRPSTWGYTSATILYDGDNVNANITFIVQGSVSGTVLNGQGVPIGAAVRLTGLGPDVTGMPVTTIRGDTTSDPASGAFGFTNVLLAGPFGLQAASPFYPVVVQTNGFTTPITPDATGMVLQFPPVSDVNGSIAGHVYNPDGSPVGEGAQVHISVSADYQIQTDTNGYFNTQTKFPAVGAAYTVQAFDPSSGLVGTATISMTPGITNVVDVHLLSRNSAVQVTVLQASGQPAPGAQVELDQGTFPYEAPIFVLADTNGVASFTGLWEGTYSATAQFTEQSTRLFARGGAAAGPNQSVAITLRLGATGSLVGTFVKQDLVTPVYGAEVTIGSLGFATTDTNGFFEFDGVPIGSYQITSSDPVTGANATAYTTLNYNGQTQTVQLVEATLGIVSGLVMDSYNNGFVSGASVIISFSDGVTPSRTVTTSPNGGFYFPASPMGAFYLNANYFLPGAVNLAVSGQANGVLSPASTNVSINIQLQPLTSLSVHVVRDDGVTPAINTAVTVGGAPPQNTSTNGDVFFSNLRVPGTYTVTAISQEGGDSFDGVQANVTLSLRGTNVLVTLMLPGVGNVAGTVVASDGSTPVANAQITLQFQAPLFAGDTVTALTDVQGRFAFDDVPLGPFLVTAVSQSLAAAENGTLAAAGQTNVVALRLGASGSLLGVVVRADGVTPVPGVEIAIAYTSQSLNAGRAAYLTDANGAFHFDNVPVGPILVQAADPDFNGLINFTIALTNNGQVLNLGLVPFDEVFPQVAQITPTNTTIGVPITNAVVLQFNKPLDPASIDPTGIFIHGTNGNVTSTVTLLPDTNGLLTIVRIQPVLPLQSVQVYAVFVLSGDLPGPTGGIIGSGPRDLVGRALAATFESVFATADDTPPQLLSIFPSNNAVQIDPSAVPRLVFNKTLNPTTFVFTVTGPAGVVPGSAALGINGQVMSFVPTVYLQPNAAYSMVISNVFDLSGNRAVGDPFTSSFATIDTIGPVIASLLLASNAVPTGGATVAVVATLATNEIGASVRFTQDFNPIGSTTNVPYQVLVQLPRSGSTTIRAIATDQYGNDGQVVQLVITVAPPQPPTVQFTLVSPTNGVVPTGSSVVVDVTATSDAGISNFTALAGGAATGPLLTTNGAHLRVQGFVPTNAIAGQDVQIFAQVTDNLGLSSGQQVFRLPTLDATPPGLVILGPTNNAVFNSGALLNLAVLASDNSSNITLGLTIFGSVTFTQTLAVALVPNTPLTNVFALALTNASPLGGPFTATLTATDAAGNTASVTRSFQLRGPPPTVQLVRVAPANGPVPSGSLLVVEVNASSGNGLAQLTASMTGALTNSVTTNGTSVRLQVVVPATTLAGQQVRIVAQATDILGQSSGQQTLILTTSDGTPPALTVLGPANETLFTVGQVLDLTAITSDNSSNAALSLVLSGSVSATQTIALALTPNVAVTNLFALPLTNASPLGGSFTATFTATDAATNTTVVTRTFQLKGPGPTLAFAPVWPPSGPVPSGSTFIVEVAATSGNGVARLTASITGAFTNGPVTTQGPSLVLQAQVPPTAVAGSQMEIIAEAIDTLGRSSGQQVFTLPVSDATPPTVTLLSPTNNAHLPAGPSFALTAAASDNSSNVTFNLSISGALSTTQTVALALIPNTPATNVFSVSLAGAPANGGAISAVLTATDAATNTASVTNQLWLPGTLGPAIASLRIGSNLPPLAGLTVPIEAALAAPQGGVSIRFLRDSILIGVVTNAPYEVLIKLPPTGSTTIDAIATDQFGSDGPVAQLVIAVQTNTPPAIQFGRVSPASGPVPSGSSFIVDVNASGNSNLFHITATVSGALSGNFAGDGTTLRVQGTVPPTALAGQLVEITAQAVDGLGQSTGPQVLNLPVSDGTPPTLAILSPPDNAQLTPGQPAPISVLVADNSSNVTLGLSITGIVSATQSAPVALTPNTPATNVFTVALPAAPADGSPLTAIVTATDAAHNVTTLVQVFWLPGTQTTVVWERQALGQTFNCTNGGGSYSWPNNNNWSQSAQFGDPCHYGVDVETVPSNWSTTNYPNDPNLDVILGSLGGAPANLDVSVTLHSLTIQNNGGLNMADGSSLTAVNYDFQGDGGVTRNGSPKALVLDGGTMAKSGGTNVFTIDPGIVLKGSNGVFSVHSGTLALPGSGSYYTNGEFEIEAGARLALVPAGQSAIFAGTFAGLGPGQVEFSAGVLNGAGWMLNLPDNLFQWTGGTLAGTVTNAGTVTISANNSLALGVGPAGGGGGTFYNAGLVRQTNGVTLGFGWDGSSFQNLPGATYDLAGDGNNLADNNQGSSPKPFFNNFGLMRKSSGNGASVIGILPGYANLPFQNLGGAIEVDSGTLVLNGGGSSSNGAWNVLQGAVLDLTGGAAPTWGGQITGSGSGQAQLNSGILNGNHLNLNLPDGLFQWTGGTLQGNVTNSGVLTVSGTNSPSLGVGPAGGSGATFYNAGLVRQTNGVALGLGWDGTSFQNLTGGVYELAGDGNRLADNNAGSSTPPFFSNSGLIRKSSGTGVSAIGFAPGFVSLAFNNEGGTIEVDQGVLVLNGRGTSSNGTFNVSSGAVLDLTGGASPTWAGAMTGGGAGQVQLNSGVLNGAGLMLNLPGSFFQWTGGTLAGTATNAGVVTISGTNSPSLGVGPAGGGGGTFYNAGVVRQSGATTLGLGWDGSSFRNLPGGVYDLAGDGNRLADNNAGSSISPFFSNLGLIRKSSGTGVSAIGFAPGFVSLAFNNEGGTIEVDQGVLVLNGRGTSSNGTFNVSSGAVLDLTGGASPTWAGAMTGGGAGQVQLNSGVLNGAGLMLNLPGSLFQWSGGTLAGTATNAGVVTISGTNSPSLGVGPAGGGGGTFYNAGVVRQTGATTLGLGWDGTSFQNLPGAVYDLAGDGNNVLDNNRGGSPRPVFNNSGLLRKSSGTNTTTITVQFNNQTGSIEVDSGVLSLGANAYVQGAAALTVMLGGTNSGQSGQLSAGSASLSGPLTVVLTNGFVPAPGDQFQVLSSAGLTGRFNPVSVPPGFLLHYLTGAVVVVFTGQSNPPPTLQFTRVAPASGPLPSGSAFEVDVSASDNDGIAQITAAMSGAVTGSVATNGASLRVVGVVPATALAGQQVQIVAQALDNISQSTGPQTLTLPISDGTPPMVAILGPPPNTRLPLGQPLLLSALTSDNSTNVTLNLSIFGSLAVTQTVAVTLTPNTPLTNVFTVPLNTASSNGGMLTAALTGTDAAGNASTVARNYWLPPSQTVTVTWQRQALGQTLTCTNGAGDYTWPNNDNWSQSAVFGDPCHSGELVPTQPSNWSTTNYPNGPNYDVILGSLGGAPANLNTSVTLNGLTMQSDGGLNLQLGTALSANEFDFEGDSGISVGGGGGAAPTLALTADGTMTKSAGTNTFAINPQVVLTSAGGVIGANSGTLALPGNNSSYTDGAFNAASNATLVLIPANNSASFAGTFTGSGEGAVLLSAGTLNPAAGGVDFDLAEPLFQWTGGIIAGSGPMTNSGALALSGAADLSLDRGAQLNNAGLVRHRSGGRLDLRQNARLENLSSGTYDLESDVGLFSDDYAPQSFDNFGTLRKSGGTNVSTISVLFNNQGGSIEVDSGTLALANSGSSSNGTFTVAGGAVLDWTGGQNPTWAGQISGSGAGTLLLDSGTVSASPSATLNFTDGLFLWSGGNLAGVVSNLNVVGLSGTNPSALQRGSQFYNLSLLRHRGSGPLDLRQNVRFENLSGGTYDLESDGGLFTDDYAPQSFDNYGTLRKSSGSGNSAITSILFNNLGGLIDVESGTLTLANNGSSSNGAFTVASGAVLDLTGGQGPTWAGLIQASGGGQVALNSGTISASPGLTLNCVPGLFQWNGGSFAGTVVNSNQLTISGAADVALQRGTEMDNAGLVRHGGSGRLNLRQNARFENLSSAAYELESDSGLFTDDYAPQSFDNFGLLRKSGGTNVSTISISFNNRNGLVEVDSGTLALANSGNSSNGTFTVATGATLDVTGGQAPTWAGRMNGIGAGTVLLAGGTLQASPSAALNFTDGMFLWSGGTLVGVVSNLNVVSLSGTNARVLERGSQFYNPSLLRHRGSGPLDLRQNARFENLPGGTYGLESDSALFTDDYGPQFFDNYGTFRKSSGSGNSAITSVLFNNLGGLIDVESGTLTLANNGASSNGTFTVASGAVLDLTGGQGPTWAGLIQASGAGQVALNSGTISASPSLTLNCAPGLFRWNGGTFLGTVVNSNQLAISGAGDAVLQRGSEMDNAGLVRHGGSGRLNLRQNARFENLSGGTYELESDTGLFTDDYAPQSFDNFGTLRKSGGTNVSTISIAFNNHDGSIDVESGTLALTSGSFLQGSGAFTVVLGGTNAGQFGQLSVSANASLSGPLNVGLTNGFVPPIGSQFQILSCASRSGAFSSLAMPNGLSVNYSNNGVFLVVTGAVTLTPPSIVSQPSDVTNVTGGLAVFHVTTSGAAPLSYQWQFDGNDLADGARVSGSQSGVLLIAGLSSGDAGNYQVVAANPLGSATSRVASLTLVPCAPVPSGLAGFWSGNGSAADLVGGHDGTLQSGAAYSLVQDALGQAGFAFSLDGVAACVDLGAWNAGSNWTWAAWVNPSATPSGRRTIIGGINGCYDWGLTMQDGVFSLEIRQPGGCTQTVGSGTNAVRGAWCFVAGSSDGSTGRVYVNGQLSGSAAVDPNYVGTASGVRIGGEVCCAGDNFPGLVDQVALFNRALTDQEILALYAAGSGRLCLPPISSPPSPAIANVGANASLQLLSPRLAEGRFSFGFPAVGGQNYVVERNDDLNSTNWTYYTNFVGNGSLMWIDAPVTNLQRFFRLRRP